ncbi:MAG: hypothetical protein ACKODG_07995, partial [Betaproteobacteria bacterium]
IYEMYIFGWLNVMNFRQTKTTSQRASQATVTKLFYTGKKDTYRDTLQEDSFLTMLAEGGYQVGELAKLMYPQGVEVTHIEHTAALVLMII